MTAVSILPESITANGTTYRAVAGDHQSVGKTPGEALDALTAQLDQQESGTLVIVQNLRPDCFFTAEQQQRLQELMDLWRKARDAGGSLPAEEQAELTALIETELQATAQRAQALLTALAR